MPDISMLDLRANLTSVLDRARQGESFTVIRFGSPVAEIGPFTSAMNTSSSTVTFDDTQATPTDASHPSKRPSPKSDPQRARRG